MVVGNYGRPRAWALPGQDPAESGGSRRGNGSIPRPIGFAEA
jgi:hypothetical protein